MDDPATWLKQAKILDGIYASQKKVAQTQLRNQVHFLVTDIGEAGFYPVRRIVDGIEDRDMAIRKSAAQEIQRYRHHLKKCGFEEIRPKHPDYTIYYEAYLTSCNVFETSPSATDKMFWVKAKPHLIVTSKDLTNSHILKAMERFGSGEKPDGFKKPRGWYVVHPTTQDAFPLKGVYGLATGRSCSHDKPNSFKTGDAIRKLRKLGFSCIDTRKNLLGEELQRDVERSRNDTSEARQERLRSALRKPAKTMQAVVSYHRNPDVIAERLHMAQGECEHCGNAAPFLRKSDSTPFLEVHHVIPLADGGDDTVENTRALCPNCHRKAHHG